LVAPAVAAAYEWFAANRHSLVARVNGQPPCELCVKEDPDKPPTCK
jgi:hypothetical protein